MTEIPSIREYMTRELITLSPEMELLQAMRILLEKRISGAPVIGEQGELIGVLSKKDCLKAALNASYHQEWGGTVADYMTREVDVLDPDLALVQAAERFIASPYRRFPVVRDGRLLGQISRVDLLRALSAQWG
jgi:predicted transcriptional regulator